MIKKNDVLKSNRKKKERRYPDFNIVEIPTHMLDSIWIKKDSTEIKIVFATGPILSFRPVPAEQALAEIKRKLQ